MKTFMAGSMSAQISDLILTGEKFGPGEISCKVGCSRALVSVVARQMGVEPMGVEQPLTHLTHAMYRRKLDVTLGALYDLFMAITEEGLDVEAAIDQAETVLRKHERLPE